VEHNAIGRLCVGSNAGWYVLVKFDEDAQGNRTGPVFVYLSPSKNVLSDIAAGIPAAEEEKSIVVYDDWYFNRESAEYYLEINQVEWLAE
jgi:hypothetical protein